jgi:zinc protease
MDKAIEGIMAELDRLRHEPVAPDELGEAQDFLIGSLALRLETNDGVASSLVGMELFNLGLDYLERYPTIIRSLTPADVQAAAERHLLLEHATLVVAGPVK